MPRSITVETVAAFLSQVEKDCHIDDVLFRGQPASHKLLPRIARSSFRHRGTTLLSTEKGMIQHFRRRALPLLDFRPENDWEWLAVAQHYGTATRLLDWTQNPLAALWFAVQQPAENTSPASVSYFQVSDGDRFDPRKRRDPLRIRRTFVFQPPHIAQRISRQAGWFTAHYCPTGSTQFVALNDDPAFQKRLHSIVIPTTAFSTIRATLDRCGINRANLMADLEGLARHIDWLHSRMTDER